MRLQMSLPVIISIGEKDIGWMVTASNPLNIIDDEKESKRIHFNVKKDVSFTTFRMEKSALN